MSRLKILGAVITLAALYGSWLLLRDAPLFAVQSVAISGVEGAQAPAIRTSLEDAARAMTSTDLRPAALRAAVSAFAVVKNLHVHAEFPNGVSIQVVEELPVMALVAAGQAVAVGSGGRILGGAGAMPGLPSVAVAQLPVGPQISDPLSIEAVELLDIAPPALRPQVAAVTWTAHGLTAVLRGGPALYFGDTTRLHAKWAAVASLLADSQAARSALYVDVHAPDRPAAQIRDPATTGAAPGAPGTASGALVSGTVVGG